MFRVTSANSTRTYADARGVAKDLYFREKKAGKTSLNMGEGIKFYMGFIGENLSKTTHYFPMNCGGKKIIIEYFSEKQLTNAKNGSIIYL